MLESELQRKKELVARIGVALKRRQEKMIKARSRFKHMARSLYWSVIWPSITSRYNNGRGFDATASFPGHLGLHSMRERVKGLGGELQIESVPGQGTRIRASVPVQTAANNTGSLTA